MRVACTLSKRLWVAAALDTHANVSLADATTNLSSLYNCFDAPRRLTFNMSEHANTWLGANLSNTSAHWLVRSWHATMLLSLSMASYADDISCFNFTQPFPSLHCAALLRFVNRTVEVVKAPPKPFTIERLTANDVMATIYACTPSSPITTAEKLPSHRASSSSAAAQVSSHSGW